jgi:hypothetical protein
MTRRFSVTDAMVLVVAIAIALAAVRPWVGPGLFSEKLSVYGAISKLSAVSTSLCVYLSIAILVLSLRRPRLPGQPCIRPGRAACLAIVLASLFILVDNFPSVIHFRRTNRFYSSLTDLIVGASATNWKLAPSIVAAWVVLALSGNWSADSGWLDRLGRGIGIILLLIYVVNVYCQYYSVLF